MFQQVITIARNTFVESIRQPVFVVLVVIGGMALVMVVPLTAFTLEKDNKLLVEIGLSTLCLVGLALAAFTAAGVLNREVENKTVLTVISKPVPRPMFVLAKYVGVAAALFVAYWTLSLIFLLAVRHEVMQTARDVIDWPVMLFGVGATLAALVIATLANYFYHRVFASTFVGLLAVLITAAWGLVLVIDKEWSFQSPATDLDVQKLVGLLLIFELLLIITAVAIAASTRLGWVMTLLTCFGVFLIGLVSEYFLGGWASEPGSIVAKKVYEIVPNFQLIWPCDALTQEHDFTSLYVASTGGYTILYVCAVLALAMAMFQTRELG